MLDPDRFKRAVEVAEVAAHDVGRTDGEAHAAVAVDALEVDEAVYGVGRDAQDVDEQIYPELLRVLLLVVGARGDGGKALLPPLDELLCLFLAGRHTGPPASLSLPDNFKA